jgi:hypothetical protein
MMRSIPHLRIVFTALALSFLIVPAICQLDGAFDQTFGSKVEENDLDESKALNSFAYYEFAFWDDGTPGYDANDPVYIHFSPGNSIVSENDIRLTRFSDFAAGTKVRRTDIDHDKKLTKFANAEPRYIEYDSVDGYSLGDPVYLDINPGVLGANDIRLTNHLGYAAGTRINDSDADRGMITSTLPGSLGFYNSNGNVNSRGAGIYDFVDSVYVDVPPSDEVTVNDIRISV